MKLLLRRTQHASLVGPPTFTLDVRAETSPQDRENIAKYRLGGALLYSKYEMTSPGSGLLGALSRAVFRARNLSISVNDLANGKRIQCRDIIEMLTVEEHVKKAAVNLGAVLHASHHFGGEEVIPL